MAKPDEKDIGAIFRDGRLIDEAVAAAHAEVLRLHRQLGMPLVIWRDGRVAEITVDEFERMEEEANAKPRSP